MRVDRSSFRAMGSAVEVIVVGAPVSLAHEAQRRVEELEQRWSRFLPDSEISRINAAQGAPVEVAESTVALIEAMVSGSLATDGAYDPTLLAPLVDLGYGSIRPAGALPRVDVRLVAIDRSARTIVAPAGTCLDPGGIGKGLAADLVARWMLDDGAAGALVSVGGDVAVVGHAPRPGGWMIAVGPSDVCVRSGGVATSGTRARAWSIDGRHVHHLLDPVTARPCQSGVVEATVVAGETRWAEVWTKALVVRGAEATLPRLDSLGLGGRVVLADGREVCNRTWSTFVSAERRAS
jgi:thiamine biosynthesis lipoprotein